MSHPPTAVRLLLFLSVSAAPVGAESREEPSVWLSKGRTTWGVEGAFGIADERPGEQWGSVSILVGRVLTDPVGPGWLRGRLGLAMEAVPAFFLAQGETTYGAGFNLLGRHYLERKGALRPFLTWGAGMLVSTEEIPAETTNVNFTPQIGFGFMLRDAERRLYTLELRMHHISNGGRVHPNPGMNSVVFELGILFAGDEVAGEDAP